MMKKAQVVHNPTAGNAEHSREEILNALWGSGYELRYTSTDDDDWKKFYEEKPEMIFVAGGDGTVHKVASVLLNKENAENDYPSIQVLPLGTANNIARTLGIPNDLQKSADTGGKEQDFDCGRIKGVADQDFFLEAIGCGIFPELISEMKKNKVSDETPSEKLQRTLRVLLKIVREFKAKKAKIKLGNFKIEGSFLMVELMNINYIGPNLELAPDADPGDGYFDLVLIPEENRPQLERYLRDLIKGEQASEDLRNFTRTLRVQKVKMKWYGSGVHVDDDLIPEQSGESFKVKITPGVFRFIRKD